MKTLYLDCGMGAAGDMLTAALLELLPDAGAWVAEFNALGIPGVRLERGDAVKCGITGTRVFVTVNGVEEDDLAPAHEHEHHAHEHEHHHDHEHHRHEHEHIHDHDHHHHDDAHEHSHDHAHPHVHRGMADLEGIFAAMPLPQRVREDALAVYRLIAEAESAAHGVPVSEIHFHEVGAMDAVADVTAVCMLMDRLQPDQVVVSPVHVGSGHVRCAHGVLPVPAPATAHILRGVPIYGGEVKGELCTPTGAALLKHFATRFGAMPPMRVASIGYGMGKRDFPMANCVRAMLGEAEDRTDAVLELSCNVDDMTAEAIAFATQRLFEGGAHEVYTVPIGMKKSRPGTLIRAMCDEADREKLLSLFFAHTTTLGVRETVTRRFILERSVHTLSTPYGHVRRKDSAGYGVRRSKLEYEDLARIAIERGVSLDEARRLIERG